MIAEIVSNGMLSLPSALAVVVKDSTFCPVILRQLLTPYPQGHRTRRHLDCISRVIWVIHR